ncbi:MAG: c-type cytochrome biogenesis protein CcsB [Armatimonadota bacterium]|nr:c-type cytochrome biogenesis protein CcsB [Armatimonadota bacterium]
MVSTAVLLFKISFWLYVVSAAVYLACLLRRSRLWPIGRGLLFVGLCLHTASLVLRYLATGHPPFLNLYEYLLSFTWAAVLVYLVVEAACKTEIYGAFVVPLICVFALVAYFLPGEEVYVMPALKSAWRVPHIATAILAYSAFLVAFVLAVLYLVRERVESRVDSFWRARLPQLDSLDRTMYRVMAFGFLMQTLLIITGAMWAQYAWGRYWGWDPKETWALVTWFIYAAYLHTRITMGWRGRRSAVLAIIGFVAVLFTLFGVTLLLSGLHSYA